MKNKEKQIEEMTEFLRTYSDIDQSYYDGEWQPVDVYSGLAKTLYNKDFRIVNEDSVVIPKEEYEEYQKFKSFMERNDWESVDDIEATLDKCQEVLYERLKQTSKKIAEKFYNTISYWILALNFETENKDYDEGFFDACKEILRRIDYVATSLGIEIKE